MIQRLLVEPPGFSGCRSTRVDRLSRRQKRRFDTHLAGCPHCRAYLDQIKTTIALTGRVEPDSLDPEARATLLDMYRRFHSGDAAD